MMGGATEKQSEATTTAEPYYPRPNVGASETATTAS